MWWIYNTLTEKSKQLHKHAKHFGWKFREAHFQAKQVFTQLKCDLKFTKSSNQEMQYTEVQNTEAEYKTKAWRLHNSDGLKTKISTIHLHLALHNESKLTQLFNM